MTVENSVSKTPKLVMGAKTYDFNFDVLLEDPTAEEAKRAIKCSISNGTEETELIYGTDYTVTLNSDKKGGVITVTDTKNSDWHIVIYRQYNMTQGVDLNDYNEFPAETIERAFDKQTMLIQELKEIAERSVKVTPANNQTPEELLDEVYSKLDSATEVATNAIAAATLATTAAESATKAVEDANQQVAEVTKYIDDKKVEIDGIVVDAQNSVDGAITQAVEDVKQAAEEITQETIQNEVGQYVNMAKVHADNSKIWTEGTDAQVQGLGGTHSSKTWNSLTSALNLSASTSETNAQTYMNNAKTYMDNAFSYAESVNPNNLLNKSMITNCITHIPQDINLELNNGTLTLKAGSKVYVPNGFEADGTTPKFDYVTIANDLTYKSTWGDGHKNFAIVTNNQTVLRMVRYDYVSSGATQPTPMGSGHAWYDTANNIVKRHDGTSWLNDTESFFIAEMTGGSDGIASVDQVFNGFGYIGSTLFLLPGVRGLYPNSKNKDGSLKSIEYVSTKVSIITNPFGAAPSPSSCICMYKNGEVSVAYRYVESETAPTTTYTSWYNPKTNKVLYNGSTVSSWSPQEVIVLGYLTWDYIASPKTNTFTSLKPKLPFQAVDRNDLKQVELPIGSVIPFAANSAPNGYLICNGATVSRTTYADLFKVIGTTYGTGDGSTTFNLPQLSDGRFIRGESVAGNVHSAGLPNITGGPFHIGAPWQGTETKGALIAVSGDASHNDSGGTGWKLSFDASKSNSIYGKSSTVMPQSLSMRYYIK